MTPFQIPSSNMLFNCPLVLKFGMSCSLFDVVDGKGKGASGSLAGLIHKLERDRMVRKRK